MGYGGKQAARSGDVRRFNFIGNGSNTAFDLGFSPATQNQLVVTINGLVQHYDAFNVSGSTLTFTGTPASGDYIQVTAIVDAVGIAAIPDGAIANVSTLAVSSTATFANTTTHAGLATFANTTHTGAAVFANTVTVANSGVTFGDASIQTTAASGFGFKNRIINGLFDFWQRGTSGTGAVYVADRWTTDQVNTTQARSTDVPSGIGVDYSLQVSGSSGTVATAQKIESKNVRDLAGQQVTVSFYAKAASGSPTLNFDVRYATALDNFAGMTIMQGSTVALSTTWTRYSFTFSALSTNVVNGLALFFYNTSTQTFLLSQVQLEKGSTATSFDYRPYGTELALCQRYYEKSFDDGVAPADGATGDRRAGPGAVYNGTNWDGAFVSYKASKRVIPTVTFYRPNFGTGTGVWLLYESGTTWTAHTMIAASSGVSGFVPGCTLTTGSNGQAVMSSGHWAAAAEL
jgi:hypothetical protein